METLGHDDIGDAELYSRAAEQQRLAKDAMYRVTRKFKTKWLILGQRGRRTLLPAPSHTLKLRDPGVIEKRPGPRVATYRCGGSAEARSGPSRGIIRQTSNRPKGGSLAGYLHFTPAVAKRKIKELSQ